MITLLDILKIDHTTLNTYHGYKWVKDNVPGYSDYPGHEHMVDLTYPETKDISYGDLIEITRKDTLDNTPIDELFLMSDYMTYSDYDNSCMVERSNHKIFMEQYGEDPGVFGVYGGYGTTSMAIALKWLLDPANEEKAQEIIDLLTGLNNYPCLDDEDMSNMEYEAFNEALEDYGISDTCGALSKKYGIDVHDYNREKLKELILDADRNGNPVFMIESGGSCYIDIDDMITPKITREQFLTVLTDYEAI